MAGFDKRRRTWRRLIIDELTKYKESDVYMVKVCYICCKHKRKLRNNPQAPVQIVKLKETLMIKKERISEIIEKIALSYRPDKIILFGSYAGGQPDEHSDVDIFVIKESALPRPQRTMELRKLLLGSGIPIDLIVYTPDEVASEKEKIYSFVYQVLNSGTVVYERKKH